MMRVGLLRPISIDQDNDEQPTAPTSPSSTNRMPYVEKTNALIDIHIFPEKELVIPPRIINALNQRDTRTSETQALRRTVKLLMNYDGKFPASSLKRMADLPSMNNGALAAQYSFLHQAPKDAHHFYCEFNEKDELIFLSVRKADGESIASLGQPQKNPEQQSEHSKKRSASQPLDHSRETGKRQRNNSIETEAPGSQHAETLSYEMIKPQDSVVQTLTALPPGQKNATKLFKQLGIRITPYYLNMIDRFLNQRGGVEPILQNFSAYLAFENAFLKAHPNQVKSRSKHLNLMRTACFPSLPSQRAAVATINRDTRRGLGNKNQS